MKKSIKIPLNFKEISSGGGGNCPPGYGVHGQKVTGSNVTTKKERKLLDKKLLDKKLLSLISRFYDII